MAAANGFLVPCAKLCPRRLFAFRLPGPGHRRATATATTANILCEVRDFGSPLF